MEIAELRARIAEDRAALEPLTLELQEIRGRIARKEREFSDHCSIFFVSTL